MENLSTKLVIGLTEEEQEQIKKMFGYISRYDIRRRIDEMSYEELVQLLTGHNNNETKAILKTCTHQEINDILLASIEVVFEMVLSLTPDKLSQLMYYDKRQEMKEKIEGKLPELFAKIKAAKENFDLFDKLSNNISNTSAKINRNISAIMATEEEAQKVKDAINGIYDNLEKTIKESALDNESTLLETVLAEKNQSLALVDTKLAEEPVMLYYYKTGGKVAVKVNWRKGYSYRIGRGQEVRRNRSDDCGEYPMIVSANYIMDFLYQNKVRDVDIWVDPKSVDVFYTYNNNVSINLTPSFVAEWWNYDCPNLYRNTPNKDRSTNMMGDPICHFSNQLIESSFSDDYIDEDITREEFEKLTKGYEHTGIYKSIKNVLDAREVKDDEKKVEEIRKAVNDFDARVQKAIDDNEGEILDFLKKEFKDRVTILPPEKINPKNGRDFIINDNFGLDCGFLNIKTTSKEYVENRGLLRSLDRSTAPWMSVNMPYLSQSLTLQREEFNKVQEIVKRETGIALYCNTMLD